MYIVKIYDPKQRVPERFLTVANTFRTSRDRANATTFSTEKEACEQAARIAAPMRELDTCVETA